jgi:hypothetical protein
MFQSNGNLPPKSIPVRIVMDVRCVAMNAAMCVCAKADAAAKPCQPENLDLWEKDDRSKINAATMKI